MDNLINNLVICRAPNNKKMFGMVFKVSLVDDNEVMLQSVLNKDLEVHTADSKVYGKYAFKIAKNYKSANIKQTLSGAGNFVILPTKLMSDDIASILAHDDFLCAHNKIVNNVEYCDKDSVVTLGTKIVTFRGETGVISAYKQFTDEVVVDITHDKRGNKICVVRTVTLPRIELTTGTDITLAEKTSVEKDLDSDLANRQKLNVDTRQSTYQRGMQIVSFNKGTRFYKYFGRIVESSASDIIVEFTHTKEGREIKPVTKRYSLNAISLPKSPNTLALTETDKFIMVFRTDDITDLDLYKDTASNNVQDVKRSFYIEWEDLVEIKRDMTLAEIVEYTSTRIVGCTVSQLDTVFTRELTTSLTYAK